MRMITLYQMRSCAICVELLDNTEKMMKKLCIIFATILAGCATPIPSVVKVNVPVEVPCKITPPAKPKSAVDALPLGSDIWDQMLALRADRLSAKGYEGELESAITACQK